MLQLSVFLKIESEQKKKKKKKKKKKIPEKKTPVLDGITVESFQTLKDEMKPTLHEVLKIFF